MQLQSQLQAVAVKVFLRKLYTLCSLDLPTISPNLDALVHDLSSPFLILRNFNGRHSLRNDGATNLRGVFLAYFMKSKGLELR